VSKVDTVVWHGHGDSVHDWRGWLADVGGGMNGEEGSLLAFRLEDRLRVKAEREQEAMEARRLCKDYESGEHRNIRTIVLRGSNAWY